MGIAELILTALSLSMDATSVGMTNGMTDRNMTAFRAFVVAFFYGAFQFVMPLIGYYASGLLSALIEEIAPWISFVLLAFIGGKLIFDGVKEVRARRRKEDGNGMSGGSGGGAAEEQEEEKGESSFGLGKLTVQAFATSIDALAVGVTFLALETAGTLPLNIWADSLIIGAVTFALSFGAVWLGKAIGDRLAGKAEIAGGAVLVAIGLKILIEGLL